MKRFLFILLFIASFPARSQEAINNLVSNAGGDLYEAVYGTCIENVRARCEQENGAVSPELQALLRNTGEITDSTVNGLVDQFYRRAANEQAGILNCEERRLQSFFGSNGNGRHDPGIETEADGFARTVLQDVCSKIPELKLTYNRFKSLDTQMAPVRARQNQLAQSILPPFGRAANWYVPPSEAAVASARAEIARLEQQLAPLVTRRRQLFDRYTQVMASVWKGNNPHMEAYVSSQYEQAQPDACVGAQQEAGVEVRRRFRKDESGPIYRMIRQVQSDGSAINNLSNRGKALLFERSDLGQALQDYASAGNYRAQLAVCRINAEERGTEAIQQTLDYGSLLLGGVGLALRFARITSLGIRGLNTLVRGSRVALLASSAVGSVSAARGISEECFANIPANFYSGQTGSCEIGAGGWAMEQRVMESENCALAVAIGAAEVAGGLGDYLDIFKRGGRGFNQAEAVSRQVAGQTARTDAILAGGRVGDEVVDAAPTPGSSITVTATGGTREQRSILTANRLGGGEDVSGRLSRLGFTRVTDGPEGVTVFRNASGSQIVLPAGDTFNLTRAQRNRIEVVLNEGRGEFTYPGLSRVDPASGRTLVDQLGSARASVITNVNVANLDTIKNAMGDLKQISTGSNTPVDIATLSPVERLRLLDELQAGLRLRTPGFTENATMAAYRRTLQSELPAYAQRVSSDGLSLSATLRSEFRELSEVDRQLVVAGRADEVIARTPGISVDRANRLRTIGSSIGDARQTLSQIPGTQIPSSLRIVDNLPARAPAAAADEFDLAGSSLARADVEDLRRMGLDDTIRGSDAETGLYGRIRNQTVTAAQERQMTLNHIAERYAAWDRINPSPRQDILRFLDGIEDNEIKRQFSVILLNAANNNPVEALARLRRFTGAATPPLAKDDYLRSLQERITEIDRTPVNSREASARLANERSALEIEILLIGRGDQVSVEGIVSARSHNRVMRGDGKDPHSLEDAFNFDIRVRDPDGLPMCRGSGATEGLASGITGGFFNPGCSPNFTDRRVNGQTAATPRDSTEIDNLQGYSRQNALVLEQNRRIAVGRNGDVRYADADGVYRNTGGGGGGLEAFPSRLGDAPAAQSLRGSTRTPTCNQQYSETCRQLLGIQSRMTTRGLGPDAVSVLERNLTEVRGLLANMRTQATTAVNDIDRLGPLENINALNRNHSELLSTLNVEQEILLKLEIARSNPAGFARGTFPLDIESRAFRDSSIEASSFNRQVATGIGRASGIVSARAQVTRLLAFANRTTTVQQFRANNNIVISEINRLDETINIPDPVGELRRMNVAAGVTDDMYAGVRSMTNELRDRISAIQGITAAERTELLQLVEQGMPRFQRARPADSRIYAPAD